MGVQVVVAHWIGGNFKPLPLSTKGLTWCWSSQRTAVQVVITAKGLTWCWSSQRTAVQVVITAKGLTWCWSSQRKFYCPPLLFSRQYHCWSRDWPWRRTNCGNASTPSKRFVCTSSPQNDHQVTSLPYPPIPTRHPHQPTTVHWLSRRCFERNRMQCLCCERFHLNRNY